MTFMNKKLAVITVAVLLAGCGTMNTTVREDIDKLQSDRKSAIEKPLIIAPTSRVSEVRGNFLPVTKVASPRKHEWLRSLPMVSLNLKSAVPLSEVVSMLAAQGLNISSDLPLSSYSYVGTVNATDADSALKAVFGTAGLDYHVDDKRKLIVVKPMASRSWFINIGNRRSTYSSDGQSSSNGQSNTSNGNNSSSTLGMGAGGQQNQGGMSGGTPYQATGSTGNANSTLSSNSSGTGVAAHDDFWKSLSTELASRLTVMLPRTMSHHGQPAQIAQAAQTAIPGQGTAVPIIPANQQTGIPSSEGTGGTELYVKRQIGSYSLNPETGAISVQAPHWILADLDTYITGVQEMYNTDISFMGEVVLVTSSRTDSEGVDLSLFTKWAGGKYGAVISNNALGGITMTLPTSSTSGVVQAAAQSVAGPLLGLKYAGAMNALDIFNAYLSEHGKVSVIQRPRVTTTSGVAGEFSKKYVDYYNTVSQQAAAGGTGSAATATQNVLVQVELGTELRINPRIDIATGLIRAQLTLNQAIKSGSKSVPQTITFGNNTSTVNTSIPLITKQRISGEVLLRDGDLVVVGGQTEDNSSIEDNGLPGSDGPLGGLFGVKKASKGTQTYYFALRVSVNKRQ